MRYLLILSLAVTLSACSLFQKEPDNTLGALPYKPLRILPDEPIDVTHEDVQERYQRYLEVGEDSELRIRTRHRMAALKLQAEELALDSDDQEFYSESSALAVIADYEALLSAHLDRAVNDIVLYQIAEAYSMSGWPYLSIATLERLTDEYSASRYYLGRYCRAAQL